MTRRRAGEWKSWAGQASKIGAYALGAGVAVAVIVLGAVTASLLAVVIALFRTVRPGATWGPAPAGNETHRPSHAGTASRVRTTALQRAAADEAAR